MSARVVVVTGGTSAVGRAVARSFAEAGDRVAVLTRGAAGLAATLAELQAYGEPALALPVDVADAAQVEQAAARIERELGPLDLWVNNAMTGVLAPFLDMTPEEFARDTSVTGALRSQVQSKSRP